MSKGKGKSWSFNVPIVRDFADTISSEEKENLEAYFDYDHEDACSNFFARGRGLDYETIESPDLSNGATFVLNYWPWLNLICHAALQRFQYFLPTFIALTMVQRRLADLSNGATLVLNYWPWLNLICHAALQRFQYFLPTFIALTMVQRRLADLSNGATLVLNYWPWLNLICHAALQRFQYFLPTFIALTMVQRRLADELLECAACPVSAKRRPLAHQNAIDKMSPTDTCVPTVSTANPTIPIDVTDDLPVHNTGAIKKRQTRNVVASIPTGTSRRRSLSAEHFDYKPVSRGCGLSTLANKMENLQLDQQISGPKVQEKKLGKYGSKDSLPSSCGTALSLNQHMTSGQHSHALTKYVSIAEQVHKFERGTPVRFRSVSTKADAKKLLSDMAQEYKKHPLTSTIAQSPNLASRNRIRPVTAISQEERDEEALQEIRNYKFRACPVNTNILKKRSAMPVVLRKCNTKPEPFKLTLVKCKPKEPSPEHFIFTARPVPKKILEEPVGIKVRPPAKLTNAATPKFAYKPRRVPVPLETLGKHSEVVDGHSGLRSNGTRPRPQRTVVKPFSFDQRHLQTIQRKESIVKQHLEQLKSAREFHAHPCPIFKTPAKISVPAKFTEAISPDFSSKEIAERKERLFQTKVKEEMRAQQEATNFKARPPAVLSKEPFRPVKSEHQNTKIAEFHMHSDVRAKQRQEFESQKKIKENMREEQLMLLELKKREIEKAEIMRLRKEITHKAQPIRQFKSLEILSSNKPVTVPVTPNIVSRNRK